MEVKQKPTTGNTGNNTSGTSAATTSTSAQSKCAKTARKNSSSNSRSDFDVNCCVSPETAEFLSLLRPHTVKVMNSPDPDNIAQLSRLIQTFPETVETLVMDYIIYPLTHHLKLNRKLPEETRKCIADCFRVILGKWQVETFTSFAELYQYSILAICKAEDPGNFDKKLGEDYVQSIILSIRALLQRSLSKHYKKLYSEKYVAAVGHGICILLQIVNHRTAKSIRILAIRTVVLLIGVCNGDEEVGHRIFKFLPGLATTFVRTSMVSGGRFQVDIITESLLALKIALNTCIHFEKASNLITVDTNLSPGLSEISEAIINQGSTELVEALAEFTIGVLDQAKKKLPKCSETLWTNVCLLTANEDYKCSSKCFAVLKNPDNSTYVQDLVSFNTIDHFLKKSVVQSNLGELDECKNSILKVISSLLITRVDMAQFKILLPRLTDLKLSILRRAFTGKALQYGSYKSAPTNSTIEYSKQDEHLLKLTAKVIVSISTQLGGGVTSIIEELLNYFPHKEDNVEEIITFKSSAIFSLLNDVLMSLQERNYSDTEDDDENEDDEQNSFLTEEQYESVAERLIALLIPLPLIDIDTLEKLNHSRQEAIMKLTKSVDPFLGFCAHCCYILEIFPTLVQLERETIQLVVFPLLEYAGLRGDDYLCVSTTASRSIDKIAELNGVDVKRLLGSNMDVLLSDFSGKISEIGNFPQISNALIYLAVHFDFTEKHFLAFLEQVLELAANTNLESNFYEIFTNIFYAYVSSIWNHFKHETTNRDEKLEGNIKKEYNRKRRNKDVPLVERLRRYHESIGMSTENESKVGDIDEKLKSTNLNDEDELNGVKNTKLPPEVRLALKISSMVANFLNNPSKTVQVGAMDVLVKGIQILSPYENELLPLLHQCWISLAARFEEKEYLVVSKAFELLLIMVKYSGDFLLKRTTDNVFPILDILLDELSSESKKAGDKNCVYYTYTPSFKLQHTFLEGLGDLCGYLELDPKLLDIVANRCLIYLSPNHHVKLTESATNLFKKLIQQSNGSSLVMKLIAYEVIDCPTLPLNPNFKTIPNGFGVSAKEFLRPTKRSTPRKKISSPNTTRQSFRSKT